MSFLVFFIYYFISNLIFIFLGFLLYKFFIKPKKDEMNIFSDDFFSDSVIKSITDVKVENKEEKEDEKIPTYF